MEEMLNLVSKQIFSLQIEGRITESESRRLTRMLENNESLGGKDANMNEGQIRKEILKILDSNAIRVCIPPTNQSDDISSPLDTFLVLKKRQTYKKGNNIENMQILKKITQESDSDTDSQ
ncbi:hypothetical protein SteCoe_5313 [Stentor coeruleus]|uniref:Uncharacterized protein n=1 Tax=Stentor coeruleus TaxID=5963 RepID=A0A1R2CSK3_9CILI|nr:hypothetical protein SteCoe_5313 [Stentor coeruleus]